MKPPLVLTEHGDVSFFASAEALGRFVEPIDVRNGEYVAYDSEGYTLKLVPTEKTVMVTGRLSEEAKPETLLRELGSFWERATGSPAPPSLDHLLKACVQRFGFTK